MFTTFWIKPEDNTFPRIEIHPSFSVDEKFIGSNQTQRNISGGYNIYKLVGGHFRVSLPLDFVSSETAGQIRTAWLNHTPIYYTTNLSSDPQTVKCAITNIDEPFVLRSKGQYDFFSGTLRLKSVQSLVSSSDFPALTNEDLEPKSATGVFILDDPTWGKLDQTYNKLME